MRVKGFCLEDPDVAFTLRSRRQTRMPVRTVLPGMWVFHTVGRRSFPGVTETLVPGNGSLNLSAYKAMENDIDSQNKAGETVSGVNSTPAARSRSPTSISAGRAGFEVERHCCR